MLNRRRFTTGTLAAAGLLPFVEASAATSPTIGFLGTASPDNLNLGPQLTALRAGYTTGGYQEGKNLNVEYRLAGDDPDLIKIMADELAKLKVKAIVAAGGPATALAAVNATSDIPVIFTTVVDPQRLGLVGNNATGTAGHTSELDPDRFDMLTRAAPNAERIGLLANHHRPNVDEQIATLEKAAKHLNKELYVVKVRGPDLFTAAMAELSRYRVQAIQVTADSMFTNNKQKLVKEIESIQVPAIYQWKEFVREGGLLAFGPTIEEAYNTAGSMTARALNGERKIPIAQPSINLLEINHITATRLKLGELSLNRLRPGAGAGVYRER